MRHRALVVSVCSFIALFSVGAVLHHQYQTIASDQQKAHIENASGNRDRHNRLALNVRKLQKTYDESEPNLLSVEHTNRQKLNKGLSLAFNGYRSNRMYQSKIKRLLGSDLGDDVLNIVKPQGGDDPLGNRSISAELLSSKIAYGKYDNGTGILPVTITALYRTPPIMTSQQTPNDKEAHTEHLVANGDLYAKTEKVTIDNYYNDLYGVQRTNGQVNDLQ